MRICKDHWAQMRAAVDERGMTKLVSGSGEEALEKEIRALENPHEPRPPSDFDPLAAMHWNFMSRVLEKVGLEFMFSRLNEDGMPENIDEAGFNHYCPLCVVRRDFDAHNTADGRCGNASCTIQVKPGEKPWDMGWIDGCADAMLEAAVEKGLVQRQ